eukprot:296795_1
MFTLTVLFSLAALVSACESLRYVNVGHDTILFWTAQSEQDNQTRIVSNTSANPTIQRTLHPTKLPTTSPTTQPTKHPTFEPTKSPTAQPNTPTKSPTTHPTKHPTFKPTNYKPTQTPTLLPTAKPTERWDTSKNVMTPPKHKKNNNSSNLFNDDQLLKHAQRKAREHIANITKPRAQNTIKMYEYAFYPGATKQEMQDAAAMYQDVLIDDVDNKAVITRDFQYTSHQAHGRVSSYMTELDIALEELHYLVASLVHVHGSIASIDEKQFNEQFARFLKLQLALHKQAHLSGLVRNLRRKLDAFCDKTPNNVIRLIHSSDLLDDDVEIETTFKLSGESGNLIIRFLLIAYQEMLRFKLAETKGFITHTSYGNDSKIPVKFRNEFESFEKSYHDVMNLSRCADEKMMDAFGVLMMFQGSLSLFSYDLQCVTVIYQWRQKSQQKYFGIIAISAGIVAQFSDIDTLLHVLGYSADSILRFRVHVTKKRRSGFNFEARAIEMSRLSKLSCGNSIKKKKKRVSARKLSSNATSMHLTNVSNISNSQIHVRNRGIIKLIHIPDDPMETARASKLVSIIVNDSQYDIVILPLSLCMGLYHKYVMYDIVDNVFESISYNIISFMHHIPEIGKRNSALKYSTTHLFGAIIFDSINLDKSFLQRVLDLQQQSTGHDLRKFKLIVELLYQVYKQSGKFSVNIIGKYIKQDMVNGELIADMLGFMEILFMRITIQRMSHIADIMSHSQWSLDGKIPQILRDQAEDVGTIMWDRRWCHSILSYFALDGSHIGALVRELTNIDRFKINLMTLREEFAWLSVMCRIGDIIYNFQQEHDYGVIGIVGAEKFITSNFYDVLRSLGYDKDSGGIEYYDLEFRGTNSSRA